MVKPLAVKQLRMWHQISLNYIKISKHNTISLYLMMIMDSFLDLKTSVLMIYETFRLVS